MLGDSQFEEWKKWENEVSRLAPVGRRTLDVLGHLVENLRQVGGSVDLGGNLKRTSVVDSPSSFSSTTATTTIISNA